MEADLVDALKLKNVARKVLLKELSSIDLD